MHAKCLDPRSESPREIGGGPILWTNAVHDQLCDLLDAVHGSIVEERLSQM